MDGAEHVSDVHSGLKVADFVSLHVDLNRSTRHLISGLEFEIMKPSAYLINTARGSVVARRRSRRHSRRARSLARGLTCSKTNRLRSMN